MGKVTSIYATAAAAVFLVAFGVMLGVVSSTREESNFSKLAHTEETRPCLMLGLPQDRNLIPLPDSAFKRTRGTSTTNYVVGTLTSITPNILMALPRGRYADRINMKSGNFTEGWFWQLKDTKVRASKAKPDDGVFIDVGGWIGDTSLPTAAVGIDTYVFEPVRFNFNLIHISMLLNDCMISEHLTIVNALVGNNNTITKVFNPIDHSVTDQSSGIEANIPSETEVSEVGMVKLDSFFPAGTKVQHLKIDVQGFEFEVIKGAERLLRENMGRLKMRFEKGPRDRDRAIVDFMNNLGYNVIARGGGDIDME